LRVEGLGPAFRGNPAFGVGVDSLAANLFTFLALDVAGSPTSSPVLGQNVHLALTPALQILPTGLSLPAGAAGYVTAVFHVPDSAAVAGTYWLQWVALDPAGPQSLVTSNALRFVVY
jgi:hypothetical protein